MNRADRTKPSDAELVSQAQRGNPTAFAALVLRYQDRVYNTCYRMCRHDADALDLTQSTFVRALEALPRFEARAHFFTWLFRIAVNLTLSHRRVQRRRPALALRRFDDENGPYDPPAVRDVEDPSQRAEQAEMRRRLEAALSQLDEGFRAAVVLKDVEGLDYAAIAEILAVPVGTVKSRIHRGRLMLKKLLEQKEAQRGVG